MELSNYVKYCLGYVRLTRGRSFTAQEKYSIPLSHKYLSLLGLINGDTDGSLRELVQLQTFYSYDQNTIPKRQETDFKKEKALANRIEEIYNKFRNDSYTKQTVLNFGYFKIELPVESLQDNEEELLEDGDEPGKLDLQDPRIERYPLFTLPVLIEKEVMSGIGKYYLSLADLEIQINIAVLEAVLGEDLYYQLLDEIGRHELAGKFSLPMIDTASLVEIWDKVKACLRLKDITFDETSFLLEEMHLALNARANYFLVEDLHKLAKLPDADLDATALSAWNSDDDLNHVGEALEEKELYFPFPYDKYQLKVLTLLPNKTSLVEGPPGTGKSETIANLLCHLAATGSRVLFVSQKAQALKVVKDKLKRLKGRYIFGYIPNPSSLELTDDDEVDGLAVQLSGLSGYLEKLTGRQGPTGHEIGAFVQQRNTLRDAFNSTLANERQYFLLHTELSRLSEFDIQIFDIARFSQSCLSKAWDSLQALVNQITDLSASIASYEATSDYKLFKDKLGSLDFSGNHYADSIKDYLEDVEATGYDRHSPFLRRLNNTARAYRLRHTRHLLPRELLDSIDEVLSLNNSRREASLRLSRLHRYCHYRSEQGDLRGRQSAYVKGLKTCGLTDEQRKSLVGLIHKTGKPYIEIRSLVLRANELKRALACLDTSPNLNEIREHIFGAETTRAKTIANYLQAHINNRLKAKWAQGPAIRRAVNAISVAFGKSKKAFKTFDRIRQQPETIKAILDLIPIWIMELDDASRLLPLEQGLFDYLVLDEASQCNIAYTLPAMFRCNRTLFVGDSEQMRDTSIAFKTNKAFEELARRYHIPESLQIKPSGSAVQSVLTIAQGRGFCSVPLRYHYRSPAELIGFSNNHFYRIKNKELIPLNHSYLTFRNTNRVLLLNEVIPDPAVEFSEKVNVSEAQAILSLFRDLRQDTVYRDRSIGILTFFNAQAAYLRELFEKDGFKEERDNYKVSIIEGIQGDEKDIILYSFVIKSADEKRRYLPLTGEGGDIRADVNKGRVNVAFSRAKLQVHCFSSIPFESFPKDIWIRKYLAHVISHGEVANHKNKLQPFDSHFEKEFYSFITGALGSSYIISNQVRSCGFRIDFVAQNPQTGKSLAIECDGPHHFENELHEEYGIYVETDAERQRVLEAAGWRFYRVKYSDWINEKVEKGKILDDLIGYLS